MPYFILIPVWLVILVCAGGLAFVPHTRRLAAYIATCSTLGLLVSIIASTLALVVIAKLPWGANGSWVGGAVLIVGYIGGMVLGGIAGAAIGFWAVYRLNKRRTRISKAGTA